MVVYDVTSRESFDNVKTWLKEIANNASDNVVKYIIGSKKDLRDSAGSINASHVSTEEGGNSLKSWGSLSSKRRPNPERMLSRPLWTWPFALLRPRARLLKAADAL